MIKFIEKLDAQLKFWRLKGKFKVLSDSLGMLVDINSILKI